jgi:hypothetical protein
MTTVCKRKRPAAEAGFLARLRRPSGAWAVGVLAVLALVFQLGLSAAHAAEKASVSQAELAAAALGAAIGQPVVLCDQGGGGHSDPLGHTSPCCDDCALCGAVCHAATVAPPRITEPLPPQPLVVAATLRLDADETAPPLFARLNARPRAPPLSI